MNTMVGLYTPANLDAQNPYDWDMQSLTILSCRVFHDRRERAKGAVRTSELVRTNQSSGGAVSAFQYDAFGRRRVRKEYTWQSSAWVLTNEVRYVYDGMLVVQGSR